MTQKPLPGTERSFGLSVGGVLCVIAALLFWRGRIVRAKSLRIRPRPAHHAGYFNVRISSPVTGHVRLDVIHGGNGRMGHFLVPRKIDPQSKTPAFKSVVARLVRASPAVAGSQ